MSRRISFQEAGQFVNTTQTAGDPVRALCLTLRSVNPHDSSCCVSPTEMRTVTKAGIPSPVADPVFPALP